MKRQLPKAIVVCGPTATGKSDLAVYLARKFNGEVISADSRQVYKGLDIGSGKITKREMKSVPHHLLDVVDPKKVYTAEKFKNDGKKAISDILSRGKLPIICGGTGFYIDALVFDEQFPEVGPNAELRKKLEKKPVESLMKIITKLDPVRAKALDPYNKVRIIRAIEIAKVLGTVPKVKQAKQYETLWIGLTLDRKILRKKIHGRLLKRIKAGMIEEVSKLRRKGLSWKRLHAFGLEYRYLSLYLQKKMSKEEMLAKLEQEINQYAKRQMQWFKRNKDIEWFAPGENTKIANFVRKFA
jgi:tRNA dimethylallyltransferase